MWDHSPVAYYRLTFTDRRSLDLGMCPPEDPETLRRQLGAARVERITFEQAWPDAPTGEEGQS